MRAESTAQRLFTIVAYYKGFIIYRTKSFVKLVLLDESDAMTKDAQFALRRGIDCYSSLSFGSPISLLFIVH